MSASYGVDCPCACYSECRNKRCFPTSSVTAIRKKHMIEIGVTAIENCAAILAGIIVALKNVVPREFSLLLRQAIKNEKRNDARHTDPERNGRGHFVFRREFGKIKPLTKIVRGNVVPRIGENDVRMPFDKGARTRVAPSRC